MKSSIEYIYTIDGERQDSVILQEDDLKEVAEEIAAMEWAHEMYEENKTIKIYSGRSKELLGTFLVSVDVEPIFLVKELHEKN